MGRLGGGAAEGRGQGAQGTWRPRPSSCRSPKPTAGKVVVSWGPCARVRWGDPRGVRTSDRVPGVGWSGCHGVQKPGTGNKEVGMILRLPKPCCALVRQNRVVRSREPGGEEIAERATLVVCGRQGVQVQKPRSPGLLFSPSVPQR